MKQTHRVIPGLDCQRGPCPVKDCPGFGSPNRPGGGHGVRGDIWSYSIVTDDGLSAIELQVGTGIYPSTVPLDPDLPCLKSPGWCRLAVHVAFPTEKEMTAWWTPELKGNCDLLPGTWCNIPWGATCSFAEMFFIEHGRYRLDDSEQPESFWVALEKLLIEQLAELTHAEEKWECCTCCDGTYRAYPVDGYREDFRFLLGKAIEYAGGDPKRAIVLSIPDWGFTPFAADRDTEPISRQIDEFNAVNLEETKSAGAHYVDVTVISRMAMDDFELIAADRLHPSGKMYRMWAEKILPIASDILKDQ